MFSRVGSDKATTKEQWEESQTLEDAGIKEEDFDHAIQSLEKEAITESFEVNKQQYKQEKARDGLSSGRGGFKRSE